MTWLWIALLGGVVGLDSTSFPQAMISRPLVAGALTGALFGRPTEGLMVGALLEVFHIATLPIGASRYPEAGTAAVAGATAFLFTTPIAMHSGTLFLAVVFGLAWERVAGQSVILVRRANERLVHEQAAAPDPARSIERRHLVALLFDFSRGATVSVAGAVVGTLLLRILGPRFLMPAGVVQGMVAITAATVLAGSLVVFGGWTQRRWVFAIGILCGTVLAVIG